MLFGGPAPGMLRPRSHALFSGCISGNTGPLFNVPKKFGNCSNDDPGSHVAYPQPTELLRKHMWSLPSGAQLYQREGPALLFYPLLVPKNPLEPLQSPCARPWPPVHIATPLTPGPGPGWIL